MALRAKLSRSSRLSRKPKPRAGSPSTRRPVGQAALVKVKDNLSLEHHPEFLRRIAEAREGLRSGRGVRLEDLPS